MMRRIDEEEVEEEEEEDDHSNKKDNGIFLGLKQLIDKLVIVISNCYSNRKRALSFLKTSTSVHVVVFLRILFLSFYS